MDHRLKARLHNFTVTSVLFVIEYERTPACMTHSLIAANILISTLLMGVVHNPGTEVRGSETYSMPMDTVSASDTLAVSELKEQIAAVMPDSAAVPDSLIFRKFRETCNEMGYNMPVLIPDEELTSSMPQIKPEDVDTEILIPGLMDCLNGLKEKKLRQ